MWFNCVSRYRSHSNCEAVCDLCMASYCNECDQNEIKFIKVQDACIGDVRIATICKNCWTTILGHAFDSLYNKTEVDESKFTSYH